jgi:hypothetical protein
LRASREDMADPMPKPVCGSAACLALAYRDSDRDETEDGTRPKQAA